MRVKREKQKTTPTPCDAERVLIVVGPFCWGKGTTLAEAKRNAKRNMGSMRDAQFIAYIAPKSCYVNEMGSLVYQMDEPEPVLIGTI